MKIFISHVTIDEPIASIVKEYLESIFLNATVFVSGRDLSGGQVWIERLREVLHEADAIVALITSRSINSKWVFFEAGAGFASRRTIPLVSENLSFSEVGPPLSLLQARHLDKVGLESLARDIAKFGSVREPVRFPSVQFALDQIAALSIPTPTNHVVLSAARETQSIEVIDTRSSDDPSQVQFKNELVELARYILRSAITKQRASFDIPPDAELDGMGLSDLNELAQAVGTALPTITQVEFSLLNIRPIGKLNDPIWKKKKAHADLEKIHATLMLYKQQFAD